MADTKKCELCLWEGDSRGYPGHKRFVHGISKNSQETNRDFSRNSQESQKKEEKFMPEEKQGTEFCPTCHQPHGGVQELRFKAELAERDHKTALKELQDELKRAVAEAKPPEVDVEAILKERLEHYMAGGCSGGDCPTVRMVNSTLAPKFDQLRVEGGKNTLDSLLKDKAKLTELAKAGGVDLAPDRIIFGLGERELRR